MAGKSGPRPGTTGATHNLSGQRLGPKGQTTRERIIRAMQTLLEEEGSAPINLSAVARAADVRMSNLYLYFPDLGDLLLAVLGRVIDPQETPYVQAIRDWWPDGEIGIRAGAFVHSHFHFWQDHARLLQMRNAFADAHDQRFTEYRNAATFPLITLMAGQMQPAGEPDPACRDCAAVLVAGLERMSTIFINPDFAQMSQIADDAARALYIERLIVAEARVIEYVLERMRKLARDD